MTLQEYLDQPWALVGPSYTIHKYTDQIYKIVHFKTPRIFVERSEKCDRSPKGNSEKLDASISRAKRVCLEIGLCNHWDWFCTFTLDKTKYDRHNLGAWYKDFSQWIRDQRKKTGCRIRYLLIPELHQDGAWHMHGFMEDLPDTVSFAELRFIYGWKVPDKLVSGDYRCWVDCHNKFGYCSLGRLKNPVAAGFYVTKYISKSFSETTLAVGAHLYYASHGLMRASLHCCVYGERPELHRWLSNKYEFVETGMTFLEDNLDWSFALDYAPDKLVPLDQAYAGDLGLVEQEFIDNMVECVQLVIDEWGEVHVKSHHF